MPGIDGIELSQRVTDANDRIKVVFITGFAGVTMGEQQENRPQARVLSKPFHLKEIVDQVEDVLAH